MTEKINIDNHLLDRRLAGIKLVSIFLGVMASLGLISSILLPSWNNDLLNKLTTLVFLFVTFFFVATLSFINKRNYQYFAWSSLLVALAFYFCIGAFDSIDYKEVLRVSGGDGIPGQRLLFEFAAPSFLVVISAMYFRVSFVVISSGAYFSAILWDIYPTINNEKTYFTKDINLLATDIYAMNQPIFVLNMQTYIFTCTACFALVLLLSRLTNDVAKMERTNAQLGRYFSPLIREEIEKLDLDINQRLEKTQMVGILFTDIVGFTKLSEKLEPTEVLELLSEYQERMVAPIFKNQGTVDKFIGDAVMATFGTPVTRGNDAQNAISCARDMQISMREWEKERTELGQPIIKHRIGIHYGRCVVGNIGSKDRMEFAVIGDTVNVASRICDACKEVDAQILISENVKNQSNEELQSEEISDFSIRGREEKMKLHKIIL